MKRFLFVLICTALFLSSITCAEVSADSFEGHWAEAELIKWSEDGYITASMAEKKPDDAVTRAELVKLINSAYGFKETTNITFSDVKASDPYYKDVQRAVKADYVNGVGGNKFNPNGLITIHYNY